MLRERACQAGEPWTGDTPEEDHGHTDCYLHYQAIQEIERLRSMITEWDDSLWTQLEGKKKQTRSSAQVRKYTAACEALRAEADANRQNHADELATLPRKQACPPELPQAGDPSEEIERLRKENKKLAGYLMNGFVFVHERLIEELDEVLQPYLGGSDV
jgi:hypothetical protein